MTLIVDLFDAADTTSGLGASWTTSVASNDPTNGWRRANQRAVVGGSSTAVAVHTTVSTSGAQFAQVVLGDTGTSVGVLVCAAAPTGPEDVNTTGYLARHNGTNIAIVKLVAGVATSLANVAHTRVGGQVLRLVRAEDGTLSAHVNGAQVLAATDTSSPLTTGRVGMRVGSSPGAGVDSFYGGDLADMAGAPTGAAVPLTPPAQVGAVTVTQVTETTAALSWPAAARATSYVVEYRQAGATAWTALAATTATTAQVTGLAPTTNYEARVTGTNTAGPGAPSAAAPFTTPAPPPPTYRWPMLDRFGVLPARYAPSAPVTAVARDAAGRVASVTEAGVAETYTRDAAGRVATITRAGTTRTVTRDSAGRVTGVS